MHQKAILPAFRTVFAITAASLNLRATPGQQGGAGRRSHAAAPACQIRLPALK
ncbi:hypothetical protein OVY01_16160 [Robbsia sp. Bb-Pol-6]|uniref:Uncharacterized protein n=1 Tax=Robbsia betulipollinis TaxID=2981849 RepID=A0ABT3ZQ68_9BURK|nr:hypothetical protein [Robbsia betulipollinis]MCY0388711.1 hypothetical protein [Robbsia betulipollinis]